MNATLTINVPRRLSRYAEYEAPSTGEHRFRIVTVAMLTVFAFVGVLLSHMEVSDISRDPASSTQRVTVELETVSLPRPERAPEPEKIEPQRLDPTTVLSQAVDRAPVKPTSVKPAVVQAPVAEPEKTEPAPRRVYGVREVYARGLGSGGATGSGLVVKRGNTVDGRPDTLTATAADLQGELAALSTVDRAPEPVHRVKPVYSKALTSARAQGIVSAYLLVDVDGSVRDVNVTQDIGHDSREVAIAALQQFRFNPAQRGGEPVAVWILHRIRFEFQE